MKKETWKAGERRVAKFFHTLRNSLSGGNSKMTRSDTIHPELFIEAKHTGKRSAVRTLYDNTREQARAENKIPMLALLELNRPGFLIVLHSDDWAEVAAIYNKERELTRRSVAG